MNRATFFPPIILDARSANPMYQQLYDWFQRAIMDGRLRPGQRVPSTRSLAAELNISRMPVLTAYEQLYAEGYLETSVGAGTCVARSIPEEPFKPVSVGVATLPLRHRRRPSRRVEELMPKKTNSAPRVAGAFRTCDPALDQFPTKVWSALVARHARNPAFELTAYGDPMGYLPLRDAIAGYLGTMRGMRCDASQIMVVSGSQQGLQITAHALLDRGDAVWLEEPGYLRARRTLLMAGLQPIPIPVDHEGLDVRAGVERRPEARAAYVTPSHQNPTGVTMSAARRMQLLNWAARTSAWIIEDDYDSEYRYSGRPIGSIRSLDADDRVIYIGTFSKVMSPSLRLGYLVIPHDLLGAFLYVRETMDIFSPTLLQAALTDFIREGHFARHIRRMRMLYMDRCRTLTEVLGAEMGDLVEIVSAEAGMHLTGLLPPGVNDREVSRRAARIGLQVSPLSACFMNPPSRGGLVLGFGAAGTVQIRNGIRSLAEIVRSQCRITPAIASFARPASLR
jgi:GntR family transcriptional regulator / MocR family aminotransferase